MATATILRVSGQVLRVEQRSGSFDDGKPWESRTARLLVGSADFVDVKLPRHLPDPALGAQVDWAVRVDPARNGEGVRVLLVGDASASAA